MANGIPGARDRMDRVAPGKGLVVQRGEAGTPGIPLGEFGQERAQVAGLHFVEARVERADAAGLIAPAAAIAQEAKLLCDGARVREHGAAISQARQVLGGIETVCHRLGEAREGAAMRLRSMSLAGILQQSDAAPARQFRKFGQVGRLSVKMDGEERGGALADARFRVLRVEQQGIGQYVREARLASGSEDGLRGKG